MVNGLVSGKGLGLGLTVRVRVSVVGKFTVTVTQLIHEIMLIIRSIQS